ncbi:protein WFDC11-like isoform X1 [Canis lupus familiaris]|uniref:protein WFDC11-like isoform X1 n=1 Tax=Canis lupus familiaris TaxID=9615 RepID=UPI0018F7D41D|nr:protein WFDC11-like isoform X1 [Canis lupus familiaris]
MPGKDETEPDGAVRDQSHVLQTPHPKALRYPLQDLVKYWVCCQAHIQTSRVNIMKWLVFQLVTLYCLVIMPVTGTMKEKTKKVTRRPNFIVVKPKMRDCSRSPTYYECQRKCQYSWDCAVGYECCFAACGSICLNIRQIETP